MSMLNFGHYTRFHPIMSMKIFYKRKCVTLILSIATQLKNWSGAFDYRDYICDQMS